MIWFIRVTLTVHGARSLVAECARRVDYLTWIESILQLLPQVDAFGDKPSLLSMKYYR